MKRSSSAYVKRRWFVVCGASCALALSILGLISIRRARVDAKRSQRAARAPDAAHSLQTTAAYDAANLGATTLWPACPTARLHPRRHRFTGPPSLLPDWIPPPMLEALKHQPPPEILLTAKGPALIAAITDPLGHLLRFDLERIDVESQRIRLPQTLTTTEDFPPALVSVRVGHWGAAAVDDVALVIFQAGTAFGIVNLDLTTRSVRSVQPLDLDLPPDRESFVRVRMAAGPDRFGAAVARSDAVAWLEFDRQGKMLAKPMYMKSVSLPDPRPVWNDRGFGFVSRRRVDGKEWLGVVEVDPDGSSRFVGALVDDREDRTYYPEGYLVWRERGYVLGARSFGLERNARGGARFELVRVERAGKVERRECPDYD